MSSGAKNNLYDENEIRCRNLRFVETLALDLNRDNHAFFRNPEAIFTTVQHPDDNRAYVYMDKALIPDGAFEFGLWFDNMNYGVYLSGFERKITKIRLRPHLANTLPTWDDSDLPMGDEYKPCDEWDFTGTLSDVSEEKHLEFLKKTIQDWVSALNTYFFPVRYSNKFAYDFCKRELKELKKMMKKEKKGEKRRKKSPADEFWSAWFDRQGVSPDFMEEREQERDQPRENL